jgi:hypothetical protein
MSIGFPAFSTDSKRFNLTQEELAALVRDTLDGLGWRYEEAAAYRFTARISLGIWSWGEKFNVEIAYNGTVVARSECALVTQCFDWGKNASNIRAFFDQLSSRSQLSKGRPELKVGSALEPSNVKEDDAGEEVSPLERVLGRGNEMT